MDTGSAVNATHLYVAEVEWESRDNLDSGAAMFRIVMDVLNPDIASQFRPERMIYQTLWFPISIEVEFILAH
jgi:hypothetical protein